MKRNTVRRQSSSASVKGKKSGFKSFTSFPVFGGRTFAKLIPTAAELREQVYMSAERGIVFGTTSIQLNRNESRWKLSDSDQKLLKALFSKYEELEPLYNKLAPSARKQWDNRLMCSKALYCLHAIRRTQGLLAYRVRDRDTSKNLALPQGLSVFEDGTREIAQRIGTETDLMWGWWFGESPKAGRSEDLMRAVEVVKSALQSASDLDSLARESLTTRVLRASFQNLAVTAVREFEAKWLEVFPITIESVVASNLFGGIVEDTSDTEDASLNQRTAGDDQMEGSEESSEDEVVGSLDSSRKAEDEGDQDEYIPSPPPERLLSARKPKQKAHNSNPIGLQAMSSTPTALRDHGAKRRSSSAKDRIQPDESPETPLAVKLKMPPKQDGQRAGQVSYEEENGPGPMDVDSHTRAVTSVLAGSSEQREEESMGFPSPKVAVNPSESEEGRFDEALEEAVAVLQGVGDEGNKIKTVKEFLEGCNFVGALRDKALHEFIEARPELKSNRDSCISVLEKMGYSVQTRS